MTKSAKAVLRENILALITKGKPLNSHETGVSRLVAAGLARGTAQRLMSADQDVRLETLDQVSEALRVKSWQLLVPSDQKDAISELVNALECSPKAEYIAQKFDAIRTDDARQVAFALIDQVLQQADFLDRSSVDQPAKVAHGPERRPKPGSGR